MKSKGDKWQMLMSSATYTATIRELQQGDRILLYTDGIVEAANAREENS